jgi:5-formyltetrahydrofolate cyclo-ligase
MDIGAEPLDPTPLRVFRKELRARKLAEREALPAAAQSQKTERIAGHVAALLGELRPRVLSLTWPMRGEVDLRPVIAAWLRADPARRAVLPVVMAPRTPLRFRAWTPETRMEVQLFGVHEPAEGDWLVPDHLLLPPVAFDQEGFRLGYGAGFYDRTLAALSPRATAIGVAFDLARCPTIHPQPHDWPLDWVITERGVERREETANGRGRLERRPPSVDR